MIELITEALKILNAPTWRHWFALMVLLLFTAIGLIAFEVYTGTWRLNRLKKETELLAQLREIQNTDTNASPELNQALSILKTHTAQALEDRISLRFIPSKLTLSLDSLLKFLAGGAIWWLAAIYQLRNIQKKEGFQNFIGILAFAGVAGFVAIYVPPIGWPWFHLFIYPWVFLIIFVVAALPLIVPAFARAYKKAQEINCRNNLKQVGLAARMWAADNKSAFPSSFEQMKQELVNMKITCCPSDATTQYEILSRNVQESDSSAVYARCPIHNTVLFVDGSVQTLGKRDLVKRDGRCEIRSAST